MIHPGHCIDILRTMPDESVNCVVTSPPYWGLRDYGLEPVVWGGDYGCEHEWGEQIPQTSRHHYATQSNGIKQTATTEYPKERGQWCQMCSAWRGCLGLEPDPDLYIQHIVAVFAEIRRVLRGDGTVWLNLGDSYAATGKSGGGAQGKRWSESGADHTGPRGGEWRPAPDGLKPKDLCMIPARVALALQNDGWYLRSEIVWAKPNPMPESVRDRPTRSHEMIYLLSKSRRYYYDRRAVAEPEVCGRKRGPAEHPCKDTNGNAGLGRREGTGTRNRRDVWFISPKPFRGAHFATFPPDLVEPCIKAGCPEGGTVLDPFGGSGTVGMVASNLGRDYILIEANPDYCHMAKQRIAS